MTWQTGAAEIEGMLSQGELERVVVSDELATRFFAEAERHLTSAEAIKTGDYQLAYDAVCAPVGREGCHQCRVAMVDRRR